MSEHQVMIILSLISSARITYSALRFPKEKLLNAGSLILRAGLQTTAVFQSTQRRDINRFIGLLVPFQFPLYARSLFHHSHTFVALATRTDALLAA